MEVPAYRDEFYPNCFKNLDTVLLKDHEYYLNSDGEEEEEGSEEGEDDEEEEEDNTVDLKIIEEKEMEDELDCEFDEDTKFLDFLYYH
jgi:hypothetical protein